MTETQEKIDNKLGKALYDYQQEAIEKIVGRLKEVPENYNLLYQLPTGGGKTVIFSEIAKRYIRETGKKVLILTHRIELSRQTSTMLAEFGVRNKVIDSQVKELPDQQEFMCFVAMVETLNNRLQDDKFEMDTIGLIIIDEAHYNSFRKIFKFFEKGTFLGVTATPLSSNIKLPMNGNYNELIVGDSISTLIERGFLSKATSYSYDVKLHTLKVGMNGDYTVRSSEQLYSNYLMQDKLLYAYEERAMGTKTLIFNNGINTSRQVFETFSKAGYDTRHLDNTNTAQERKEILEWFKTKKDAVLTSVGILTTGFDEPSVETIIINRATRSLTLYHQMIGRGSRVLPTKSKFNVIDLGNNALRFGLWEAYVDWHQIFRNPDLYYENLVSDETIERHMRYIMPKELRERFAKSTTLDFDITEEYDKVAQEGLRPMTTIERAVEQHATICVENSEDIWDSYELVGFLNDEIEYRVKRYSYCICKSTSNYLEWLQDEYVKRLKKLLRAKFEELVQE